MCFEEHEVDEMLGDYEQWYLYDADNKPIGIGSIVRPVNQDRNFRVISLGENRVFIGFPDGDIVGYRTDEVRRVG